MADKVKVAVRVRPFNRREVDLGTKIIVDMEPELTVLYHPSTNRDKESAKNRAPKTFAYDHCFWSIDENMTEKFAGQEKVFQCLGEDVLERSFEGYNACIFAYGQTGSGKSYTMMGTNDHKGLIPRLCDTLFERIAKTEAADLEFKVVVSYMEIYNEKVHDLLDPAGSKQNLKVREHKILGPYVDGLSTLVVSSFEDIDNLMSEGNKSRTVAATNMNSESSRSHAVFSIIVTQTLTDMQSGVSGEKVSKMSLVDLAGSERAQKTGAIGERLKEGSNINKSLTTLGLVISALADQAAAGKHTKNKFVPYRDSVLTWLLKDNLGGNSKTVMVATISPAADNYEETLSTLRYADRAKRIVNHAVVNEDPNAKVIRELRTEVEALKLQLSEAQSMKAPELKDKLEESEKIMKELSKTWEEKLAETEKIHHERHAALERMGISVQTSGIRVEDSNYFLVNLNADPSLNELLVYYLKDQKTLVGGSDADIEQDIQLQGLGIQPQHCIIEIENTSVFVTPLENARTCVNGSVIKAKTKVKHGDRILWGNHHFFRVNCPKQPNLGSQGDITENIQGADQKLDYDYAQQELMMKELSNDPIQEAICAIEKQHEEDKQEALDQQRQMFEEQMNMLKSQMMSPGSAYDLSRLSMYGGPPGLTLSPSSQSLHPKYQQWAQEREKLFKLCLAKLREEVVRANVLVREANFLAQEMSKDTEFFVTLQIPASNLSPNRKRGAFVSEAAILVRRKGKGSQVWTMEKFENKMIDMREMYDERTARGLPLLTKNPTAKGDPFFESQENHNLIGVANVFLEYLFYDVRLDYEVPIISQQGEIVGRLHIQVSRISGALTNDNDCDKSSESSSDSKEDERLPLGSSIICKVVIKKATGLPASLSHFVFCQYQFWGCADLIVVPPVMETTAFTKKKDGIEVGFDHKREYTVNITEEFLEHASDGALSIEVWGNKAAGFNKLGWIGDSSLVNTRSLMDRWGELIRKIEMWVEIQELNEQGEYQAVEVVPKPDIYTGGAYQLRQGQSRRICVRVNPVQNSGTLPIICELVTSVQVGCIVCRSKLQKSLDSYQEEDLLALRNKWKEALAKRQKYLDEQMQMIVNKEDKTDTDKEREHKLMDQWMSLTEERNAVDVPTAGSCIPGAPVGDWNPPWGMEPYIPVIFLDLNADDMSSGSQSFDVAGINSILPKEHGAHFLNLPVIKYNEDDVSVVASWDSSIHDSTSLNRVTGPNERVFLIVKTSVRLSHPAAMELVLRKRISVNIYKKQSLTDKLKKRISKTAGSFHNEAMNRYLVQDYLTTTGVTYEVVSNIPKASEELEDRETLAQMAASQNENVCRLPDGETYIEKYIKGVSAVDSILTLDKLRQEVAIKEMLASKGKPMHRTASVPNIQNLFKQDSSSLQGLDSKVSIRSDSVQDLSSVGKTRSPFSGLLDYHGSEKKDTNKKEASPGFFSKAAFSLAAATAMISPLSQKVLRPMRTLMEDRDKEKSPVVPRKEAQPLLDMPLSDDEDLAQVLPPSPIQVNNKRDSVVSSDEFQEFESHQDSKKKTSAIGVPNTSLSHSNTSDSITETPARNCALSLTSSGYGSQAVSSQTLSSDDSLSARSITSDNEHDSSQVGHDAPKTGLEYRSLDHEDLRVESESSSVTPSDSSTSTVVEQNGTLEHTVDNNQSSSSDITMNPAFEEPQEEIVDTNNAKLNESVEVIEIDESALLEDGNDLDLQYALYPEEMAANIAPPSYQNDVEDIYSENALEELEALGDDERSLSRESSIDGKVVNNSNRLTPFDNCHGGGSSDRSGATTPSEQGDDDAMSINSFGSRADLSRIGDVVVPSWISPDVPVIVKASNGDMQSGSVRFIGNTEFAAGPWIGVELDLAEGKNDGTVKGKRYFKCRSRHGIFVRHEKLIWDKKRKSNVIKTSSTSRRSNNVISPLVNSSSTFQNANKKT